jgi:hypothetical protein
VIVAPCLSLFSLLNEEAVGSNPISSTKIQLITRLSAIRFGHAKVFIPIYPNRAANRAQTVQREPNGVLSFQQKQASQSAITRLLTVCYRRWDVTQGDLQFFQSFVKGFMNGH